MDKRQLYYTMLRRVFTIVRYAVTATKIDVATGSKNIDNQSSSPNVTELKIPASMPFAIEPTIIMAGTAIKVPVMPATIEVLDICLT